jgi:hypothetical protein
MQYKDSIPGNPHYMVVKLVEGNFYTITCMCGLSIGTHREFVQQEIANHKIDELVKAVGLGFEVKYEI